ncbi:ionotropic receptor 75a [Cryptotermes secundus]|uniref:ionotropic receptor 75a n=1 Tax=Cryptotermes secundus TaxID=105785 RepID=UPI001454BC02|nr:ionotropic receptor 75a [Cryptotermes secundus]
MACQGTRAILYEAGVLKLFGARSRWILLGNVTSAQSALADLGVLLDSDVIAAERGSTGAFLLVELYRRTPQDTIIKRVIGDWRPQLGVRLTSSTITFTRRTNLQKSTLKAVMVVTNNDSLLHLSDTEDRHIDTASKMNYRLFCHVADIVNASVEMAVVNSWGYDAWSGMLGYLHRGDADIGASPMFVIEERLSMVTYIAGTTRSRAEFLFRRPPLSFVDNIFTLPFSRSVWLASAGLIAVMGILLHEALNQEGSVGGQVTWSDVALLTVGAVCQQGTAVEAKGAPGRIITIFLFVAVIFLYTSYSACIVVLLQSSTTSIRTLNDLLHSGLTLGAHDIIYNRHYFREASDPIRRAIYRKKVSPPGGPQNFLPLQDGVERVRTSPFAFHMELGPGYKFVWDTFLEEEKCNLQTVPYFPGTPEPFVAVSKQTAFKEILAVAYRKVQERGLQRRETLRFYHAKPECTQRGTSFVSVGLVDFYSAVLVLGYGMLLSLGILLMEVLVHRRQSTRHAERRARGAAR